MGENTGISWCDATFNPWWGCTKVSPGCDHCYAEREAHRRGTKWGHGAERRYFGDAHWNEPLRWNRRAAADGVRRRVFCASMADVFDNEVDQQHRERLWALIRATPALDWLVLTKRIGNALGMLPADWGAGYPNVWLGATVVNQAEADRDVPKLLATPASVLFLSCEPLLGPIDFTMDGLWCEDCPRCAEFWPFIDPSTGAGECGRCDSTGKSDDVCIDWVIVGGESGPRARPMHPDWARSIRDQCQAAGVAFHFKQWGSWLPNDQPGADRFAVTDETEARGALHDWCDGTFSMHVRKSEAGRLLDGRTWDEFPGPRA